MLIKYKLIQSSYGNFTQNNIYIVAAIESDSAILFDNNNDLTTVSRSDLNNASIWELVSVEVPGLTKILP